MPDVLIYFKNNVGSRQETTNSVGGQRILRYNMDDDGPDGHDDDAGDDDYGEEDDDDNEDENEDEDDDDDDEDDDDDDDEDDEDDDEDDDDDERKMMMWMLRKKTDPKTRKHTLCEPAQSKCTWSHGHFRRAISCGNLQEKCRPQSRGHCFVRACAIETHMDISEELIVWKFRGKMPDAPESTSIKHRALTLTVRTPQCGHTVWGNTRWYMQYTCIYATRTYR